MSEILLYHSISDNERDVYAILPSAFESDMQWLSKQGYKGLSLNQFYENPEQERVVILTFDDGYQDFYENALPILNRYNFSATVFIVTKLIADVSHWREIEPQIALLDWDEIHIIIDAGHEIGSHGLYHRDLTQLSEKELREEVFDSKRIIEENTSIAVASFSYPFCKNNKQVRSAVLEAGYNCAVGCGRECVSRTGRFWLWRRAMKRGKTVADYIK